MANPAQVEQTFIAALNDTASAVVDATATATPFLAILKKKGRYRPYSGPAIEEKIIYNRPTGGHYSHYDILATPPADILTKAEWTPKQAYVPVVLSGRDIIDNMGETQVFDLLKGTIDAAKSSAQEMIYQDLFSDGTGDGGKQLTGMRAMLPDDPAIGTYAGIDRSQWAFWRPGQYDLSDGDVPGYTTLTPDTVMPILRAVIAKHSIGTKGPDLLLASPEWAAAVHARLDAIQRVTAQGDTASLGFNTIKLNIGGRTVEFAEESGIGSAMPANTLYMLDTGSFSLRYHPSRNWKVDEARKPLNQDAIVQFILFAGEFTMNNARFNAKITV